MAKQRVVLLGTGHAHLYALKHLSRLIAAGYEVVVVTTDVFWYSGLATSVLSGRYPPSQDTVDVAALVQRAGAVFIQDTVTRICPSDHIIHLREHPPLSYDKVSLALGSVTPDIPGSESANCFAVKPIRKLWELHLSLVSQCVQAHAPTLRVLVVGGGVTGCEVAANILALISGLPRAVRVTVLTRSAQPLAGLSPRAASKVLAVLQERGAEIRTDSHVEKITNGSAVLATKEQLEFDILVNATGLLPSPLVRTSGLPVDKDGGLKVDEYLRSISDRDVYGGGDCIAFAGRTLPRAGVYGVRQAPILFNNLLASSGHGRLRRFRPQARHLWIMNLGDGTGLANWGSLHWRGRMALRLKDRIDLHFVRSNVFGT